MFKSNIYIVILILQLFTSCIFENNYQKKLNSNYELSYIDEKTQMSIYGLSGDSWVGVITPTVFAVGCNEDFLIAKQHPRMFPNPPNKSITNYFIIPLKNKIDESIEENKIGPLTENEFKIKCKELDINLGFSIFFKDLD